MTTSIFGNGDDLQKPVEEAEPLLAFAVLAATIDKAAPVLLEALEISSWAMARWLCFLPAAFQAGRHASRTRYRINTAVRRVVFTFTRERVSVLHR